MATSNSASRCPTAPSNTGGGTTKADLFRGRSAAVWSNVKQVVALLQGSFGFNLELVALRNDGMLQHY